MNWEVEEILSRLQTHDECDRIEAKESRRALGKSALETISAFSNEPDLGGGYLLLGLRKRALGESGTRYIIQGVDDPDKIQQELANVCRNSFNIRIRPKISVHHYGGRNLVLAFIPEAFCRHKPVFIESLGLEKGAFRRIGSADHQCSEEDLDLLYQLRSRQHYEDDILIGVSWDDISLEAINEYRRLRSEIEPNAAELKLDDYQLLISLKAAVKEGDRVLPTVGGLLLFGTKAALRREMPMAARVDYIIVEGTEWVKESSERYDYAIEYREALVSLMPRLHSQIMGDIPSKFGLKSGQLQRSDTPLLPRDVIREAVANALMHRDYRSNQPTQIIRYSNRLEFRNAGYSLKSVEELGEPGSKPRNPKIAAVFHDLQHAETKGTGVKTMRDEMVKAGLTTPPIFESDRTRNEFDLILLPHHLLDQESLKWLSSFQHFNLSDAQSRALALTRALGAITNLDYRQLNGADTLVASRALTQLRDLGLLTMKGAGSSTYYKLAEDIGSLMNSPDKGEASLISSPDKEDASLVSSEEGVSNPYIFAIPNGFPKLPETLQQKIVMLGQRVPDTREFKQIIKELCALAPLKKSELAKILGRKPKHLSDEYLSEMVKDEELMYTHPDSLTHPRQAYKTPGGGES